MLKMQFFRIFWRFAEQAVTIIAFSTGTRLLVSTQIPLVADYKRLIILFCRVIKGFIVQTGDPTNTGKGGDSIFGEPFEDEIHADLTVRHFGFYQYEFLLLLQHDVRGILAMASNGPDTNKSQFFITCDKHQTLDGKHTVFGKLIDGFDTLEELENTKVDAKYRPVIEQRIRSATIHANPLAEATANL